MSSAAATADAAIGAVGGQSALVTDVAARARPFDLRRQETIERARLRRLQPMLETVAHRISGSLSSALRQPVRIEMAELDQLTWEDFAASLPEPTFVSSAVLLPLEGRAVLHVPVGLAFLLIDYYLGGDGVNEPDREALSEIERSLLSPLVADAWNEVPQPFSTFITLSPAMVATSSSALLVQVGRPGVLCLVVRMTVSINDHPAPDLGLCLPINVVLNLVEHLERHQSNGGMGGLDRREARRRLLSVPVELRVAYPSIGLTPTELLDLKVGDVVHVAQTDPREPQELELTVGEVPIGTGMLVDSGKHLACTVLTKKEPTDDEQ